MAVTIDGTNGVSGVDGSAGTPSYRGADADTGMLYPSAGVLAWATNGSERMRIDTSGNVGIGTATTTTTLTVTNNSSFVGSPAPPGPGAHFIAANGSNSCITSDSFAQFSLFTFRRANGTLASPSALLSGDVIGAISGRGYGATGYAGANRGLIQIVAAENWTDSAQGTYWQFNTVATGTTTSTERMRIDSTGNVFQYQPTPAAVNASATMTVANLQTRVITSTTAAAVSGTLPTGTLMDGWYSGTTDMAVDWVVINTGGTNTFTVVQGASGHTVVGNMAVTANSSGLFRSRRTAANTWITYRIS